jgi:hypothetical protein
VSSLPRYIKKKREKREKERKRRRKTDGEKRGKKPRAGSTQYPNTTLEYTKR